MALGLTALYQLWRIQAFHAWVPNTYYAKVHQMPRLRRLLGWNYVTLAFWEAGGPGLAVGLGGALLARRHREACVVLLPVVAGVAFAVWSGGDWMPNGRFVSHLVPLVAVVLVPGLFVLARWAGARAPRLRVLVGALAVVVCALTALGQMPRIADNHRRGVCALATVRAQGEAFATIGPALCDGPGPSVATPDIGGVLLASADMRVVDLAGLIEADARGPLHAPGYWPRRLARDPPQLVWVHGPWVPITGLSDGALFARGYRLLCRVGPPGEGIAGMFLPSLYVRADCARRPSARAAAALRAFCAGRP